MGQPWDEAPHEMRTENWNPVDVEKAILTTVNESARGVVVATRAYDAYLKAQRAYKKAHARAYMLHKGPQTEKKIAAELVPEVEELEVVRDAADVGYKYAKDINGVLRDKLEALRSVGVSVRQAYENVNRGNW